MGTLEKAIIGLAIGALSGTAGWTLIEVVDMKSDSATKTEAVLNIKGGIETHGKILSLLNERTVANGINISRIDAEQKSLRRDVDKLGDK